MRLSQRRILPESIRQPFPIPQCQHCVPGNHTNTDDSYFGCISEAIKALKLNKLIVSRASIAGEVCVSVAIRAEGAGAEEAGAEEAGAGGTMPLQGSDYLTMDRQFYGKPLVVNQSLFNSDWIYGMMAPKSPAVDKLLNLALILVKHMVGRNPGII